MQNSVCSSLRGCLCVLKQTLLPLAPLPLALISLALFLLVTVPTVFPGAVHAAGKRPLTLGTGGIGGVYYPTGGAISKIINAGTARHHLSLAAEPTAASVFNINAIMSGQLDFGLAQADLHAQAWNGQGDWNGRPQADLRSVLSLAPEAVTLVVADDSGITDLAGIRGKIINLGEPNSANYKNALDVLESAGLDPQADIRAVTNKTADASRLLQNGRIDGFFFTVAHPNASIKETISDIRKVRIIPIPGTDHLMKTLPSSTRLRILISDYPGIANTEDIETIGMLTTLVTSVRQSDTNVYTLVKELFEHLEDFTILHPALSHLTREGMLKGLSAPLHPGALAYYREVGLISGSTD